MTRRRGRAPLGEFGLAKRGPCGLCGLTRDLSKTHLPPQAAGNTGPVQRFRPSAIGDPERARLVPGRKDIGGIWVRGLCASCNGLGSDHDPHYATLADAARLSAPRSDRLILPSWTWIPPNLLIRPGAIARSLIIAAHGFNPKLREMQGHLAKALLNEEPATLAGSFELRLAVTVGMHARVCGPHTGMYLMTPGGTLSRPTACSVFFPPLAWELCYRGDTSLFDAERWADVSHWLDFDPEVEVAAPEICAPLPAVGLPDQHPVWGGHWAWLFASEIFPVVECDDAYAASPNDGR